MTTSTLEKAKETSSAGERLAGSSPQTAPPHVKQIIGGDSAHLQESGYAIEVGVKQGTGVVSRSVRTLKVGAFQLGLSAPSMLWFRDSTRLNVKEKVLLDAQLYGYFLM